MDADDIMLPHRLEVQFQYMENNMNVDICGSWVEIFGKGSNVLKLPVRHEEIKSKMLLNNCFAHPTIMMRKKSISKLSTFPYIYKQEFIYAEDYKLWIEMSIENFQFANIPEVLIKYRISEKQNTSRFSSQMYKNKNRTSLRYMEYLLIKIMEKNEKQSDYIDTIMNMYKDKYLSYNLLNQVIVDVYRNQLRELRRENKTKILFCIDTLASGEAEKLLIDILKHFDYNKYCVDLLILTSRDIYLTDIPNEVNWYILGDLDDFDTNIYDVEIAFLKGSALKYIAERNSKSPKIAWVHADMFNCHGTKQFYQNDAEEESYFSRMDKIIFVSENARCRFNKTFPSLNKIKQITILNLIDKKIVKEKAELSIVEKNKLIICSIGRLIDQKDYISFISVVSRLVCEGFDFELWLIGEGEQKKELETLIFQYSLESIVFLKGFQKNPYPYLKASDVFVYISISNSPSLVIGEALCLGKPIISTVCAGSRELLGNGEYGILVEHDEESIYQGLKKMIINEYMRELYSKKALLRSQMFDVNLTMSDIYSVLEI